MVFLSLGLVCRNRTGTSLAVGETRWPPFLYSDGGTRPEKKEASNFQAFKGLGRHHAVGAPRVSRLGNHSGPCAGHAGAEARLICSPRRDYRDVNRPRQMVASGR